MHNLSVASESQAPVPADFLQVYDFNGEVLRRHSNPDQDPNNRSIELANVPESLVIPSPEWFVDEVGRARDFVAELTGFDPTDLPDVDLVKGGLGSLGVGHADAAYVADRHRTYVDARIITENPSEVQKGYAIRIVTHDLAHGALERATVNVTVLQQQVAVGGLRRLVIPADTVRTGQVNAGHHKSHIAKEKVGLRRKRTVAGVEPYGNFFEEAFAEEVAMQYDLARGAILDPEEVRQAQPHLAGAELYAAQDKSGKVDMNRAGFAAAGLNMLEQVRYQHDPEGQSIFELLVAARHQATRAAAMRKLAQVVNAVQPNLYSRLNHAPDDIKSFTDGFLAISDAVST